MSKQPTIARTSLWRVLTEASLFAHPNNLLPMLNTVRLEATGTHLLAVATDRFTIGASSAPYEGAPFAVTLPMREVKLILDACKPGRRTPFDVADLRATPKGALLHVKLGETTITVPTYRGEFPRWRQLLPEPVEASEPVVGSIDLNPAYLARFAKIGRDAKFYLRGPNKPVGVRVGDYFVGVVMPIRGNGGTGWTLPDWLETAAADKAVAA